MDYTKAEAKRAARDCFTGLWAATTTPFDDSGALDPDALRRDLDRLTGSLGISEPTHPAAEAAPRRTARTARSESARRGGVPT